MIGSGGWQLRTEVPVGGDRRAFDVVLSKGRASVAVECITRLTDAQSQVRAILLKADAAGIPRIILVVVDTRWNRVALRDAAPSVDPSFPLRRRSILRSLRIGQPPMSNGFSLSERDAAQPHGAHQPSLVTEEQTVLGQLVRRG